MPDFTEAEIQVLIAALELEQPVETPNNIGHRLSTGQRYVG